MQELTREKLQQSLSVFADDKMRSDFIRLLIDNTPIAYILLDDQYRIHYINDNFLKLRQLDMDTTLGELCYNISNGGVHCRQCAVEQALKTGKKAFVARKDTLPDGSIRFIDDYAVPLTHGADKTRYVLEIMVNRTAEMVAKERRDAAYDEILSVLAILLESKDTYTASHSESVRRFAVNLATAMCLPAKDIFDISIAASLHDIGKVRIPYAIINKPDRLTDEEFEIIKSHPVVSYEIIRDLSSFDSIKNIVRHHHERFDGRGYPDGLKGEDISLGARITAVADTYDAMTSTRSYRKALSHEYALEEIARVAGSQLDPDVVKVFLGMDFGKDAKISREQDGPPPVERLLAGKSIATQKKPSGPDFKKIDENLLLRDIFENSPCGYVLMDTHRKVLFASQYFLDYLGLTEDFVLGKLCYDAAGLGALPCPNCAIERAMKSGHVEYMRQEQPSNKGLKIFDLFGMPLKGADGEVEYVIEIIIDRTDEVLLERQREYDFQKLIDTMNDLLDEYESVDSVPFSAKIVALRARLRELMEQKL